MLESKSRAVGAGESEGGGGEGSRGDGKGMGDVRRRVLELKKWMTCTPEMEFGVLGRGKGVGLVVS